jgi:hypothetical protein
VFCAQERCLSVRVRVGRIFLGGFGFVLFEVLSEHKDFSVFAGASGQS